MCFWLFSNPLYCLYLQSTCMPAIVLYYIIKQAKNYLHMCLLSLSFLPPPDSLFPPFFILPSVLLSFHLPLPSFFFLPPSSFLPLFVSPSVLSLCLSICPFSMTYWTSMRSFEIWEPWSMNRGSSSVNTCNCTLHSAINYSTCNDGFSVVSFVA